MGLTHWPCLVTPTLLHRGGPLSIAQALETLGEYGYHGALNGGIMANMSLTQHNVHASRCWRHCLSLLLALAVCLPAPVAACSPPAKTPWFAAALSLPPQTLPEGVHVRLVSPPTNGYGQGGIAINNRSVTPLYILASPYSYHVNDAGFEQMPVPVPLGMGAMYKLVNDQLFFWDYDPYRNHIKGWTLAHTPAPLLVNLAGSSFRPTFSNDSLAYLETLERTDDHRPPNTPVPPPETITFVAVYGAESMDIPLLVTYSLNPSYNPTSVEQYKAFCSSHTSSLSTLLPVVFCLVIILVAGLLLTLRQQRRLKRQLPRSND
jgi:hypothetical protein